MNIYIEDNIFSECSAASFLYGKVRAFFVINNYNLVETKHDADFILINSCGSFLEIENKILLYLEEIYNKYGINKKIIVFGCLPGISKRLKDNLNIISIPTKKEYLLHKYFNYTIGIEDIDYSLINNIELNYPGKQLFKINTKIFFIEISRGCIHKCSYCIIKKAIGYVKSNLISDIIDNFKKGLSLGYNEFVLISDDAASYGKDIGTSFDILFNNICKIEGDYTIDINYVEPGEFNNIFNNIKDNFYRVSSITCPIQSYNDRILKLMKRTYTVDLYLDLINKFRKYGNDDLKILNHIIYGYPTESFDDFKNNIKYLKLCDNNLFNLYSYREGTKKFLSDEILSKNELKIRLNILFKLNKVNKVLVDLANTYD